MYTSRTAQMTVRVCLPHTHPERNVRYMPFLDPHCMRGMKVYIYIDIRSYVVLLLWTEVTLHVLCTAITSTDLLPDERTHQLLFGIRDKIHGLSPLV